MPFLKRKAIDERLMSGESPRAVHRDIMATLGANDKRWVERSTYRHASEHVGPVKRAVQKLSDSYNQKQDELRVAKAVLDDEIDPQFYLSTASIVRDIRRTAGRLEGAADYAHGSRQFTALATVSGQLLRSHELRAKLGGAITDSTQINIKVNVEQLGAKMLDALAEDSEGRRRAAAALFTTPMGELSVGPDLGISQDVPSVNSLIVEGMAVRVEGNSSGAMSGLEPALDAAGPKTLCRPNVTKSASRGREFRSQSMPAPQIVTSPSASPALSRAESVAPTAAQTGGELAGFPSKAAPDGTRVMPPACPVLPDQPARSQSLPARVTPSDAGAMLHRFLEKLKKL